MYRQEEEITEKDPINLEDKTAFIRKKKRRRSLRAKTTIHLEEPPKQNQLLDFERINLEGNIVDSSVEGISSAKYALLQVVKKNGSVDPSNMIINVILIGDTYHFKNIVSTRVEKSLEELDNEYEKQQRLQKESNKRYHRISSALNKSLEPNQDDEGPSNVFGSGSIAGKKKGTSSKKVSDNFRGHMNDGGQDIDEEKNFDEYNGVGLEYEENLSDDEDDAELLQGVDEAREENDVDGGDIFEDDDLESDSSSEANDDDDDDEIDAGDSKDKALAQASSELSDYIINKKAAQALNTSTVTVEDGMIVVNHSTTNIEQPTTLSTTLSTTTTTTTTTTTEKRKGSPEDTNDEKNKKPRIGTNSNSNTSGSNNNNVTQGPVLTEDYVKQTIIRMGGRVNIKDLRDELKKPIKKMGDAGKTKFLEIVRKLTQSEEDAVFGKILVLKK